ncbi:bifunctional alpha/beta hydrolase/OsmC family protein [Piscinibacter sp. XHJ-5]|uniref:bifunctional alpha/beta hydrolase/OsmC family protein n=1 Tax=Piscinibacter sp. XHJ-5 TaxID=3037797 RepID=UPI002452DCAA|nr:bifunctional alpha/beta hydrolase/OsmC family protein [Piscinibacter sp. XHJ-5]
MRSQPFEFHGEPGVPLVGRLDLPDGPPHAFAIFAHCFTCSKDSLAAVRIARALSSQGIGVLRFDFTGLGQSGGDFADSTFSGSVQDLLAAACAMSRAGMTPKLLIGHSLGGAAVVAAASDLPSVTAVATLAAPFDVQHVTHLFASDLATLLAQGEAQVNLGGRPFRMRRSFIDDLARHDQGQRIGSLRKALLVLHAPMDTTVDISNATRIFQAAHHPKSFVSLDDANHLLTRPADAEYAAQVIAAWAARYVGGAPARMASERGEVVVEETGIGNFQVEVHAGSTHFLADEPADIGGLGSGPTPYELLSAGLGACTVMTLRMYARHKRWSLERVRVCVGHTRDTGQPLPDAFVREIAIEGELDATQRARLIEIAERCPVHRSLEHGARITTREVGAIGDLAGVETAGQHAQDLSKELGGA